MERYHVQIIIERDEDGLYIASCPSLQGCYSQGQTIEEAIENVKDVIEMCLEELKEERKTIRLKYPEVVAIKEIEVTA